MMDVLLQHRFAAPQGRLFLFFAALCSTAFLASGCAVTQKKAKIPWATAVLVHPTLPEQIASADDGGGTGPNLGLEIPVPEPLAVAHTVPLRPRIPAPPVISNGSTETHDMPQIVPDLSPQQSSTFQQETEQSLGVAERNLAAANGRRLNPTQADLASKIRSFVRDAREAGRSGDWGRARDLARKAQVLSDELAASLS